MSSLFVFFFSSRGTYDIYVETEGSPKLVGAYKDQGSFGELALMYNMPRAATIVATSLGSLWAMVSTSLFICFRDMKLFIYISAPVTAPLLCSRRSGAC